MPRAREPLQRAAEQGGRSPLGGLPPCLPVHCPPFSEPDLLSTAPPPVAAARLSSGRAARIVAVVAVAACSPWRGLHEAEQVWHDADRIEAELGLALVPLQAAAPLGSWPRVVVRSDRIDVDNRAWFLSLPDAYFLSPEASVEDLAAPLVVKEGVVALSEGWVSEADLEGALVVPLYEVLQAHADRAQDLGARGEGYPSFGGDLTLVAEPDVPVETLAAVAYAAGQAEYGSWMLAGRAAGRLQGALSMPPLLAADPDLPEKRRRRAAGCLVDCTVLLGGETERAVCGSLPPVSAAPGCAAADLAVVDALARLAARCVGRWAALPSPMPAAGPARQPEACIGLTVSGGGVSTRALVDEMARVHAHHPALRQPGFYTPSTVALERPAAEDAACAFALDPSSLTEAQLDVACQPTRVPRWIAAQAGLALDHPARRWRPLSEDIAAAFAGYATWYGEQASAAEAAWTAAQGSAP